MYAYVKDPNTGLDIFGLDYVYRRLRNIKDGKDKPYVGSAINGVNNRYTKSELEGKNASDKIQTPDHDTTRGVEQLVYEYGKQEYGDNYWDNINNPVSPLHKGGEEYKDGKDKYTYRTDAAKDFLERKYGVDRETYNDVIKRMFFNEDGDNKPKGGCPKK